MTRRYALTLVEAMTAMTVMATLVLMLFPTIDYNSKKTEYRAGYQRALNTLNSAYATYLDGGMDEADDDGYLKTKVNDPAYIGTTNSDGVTMTSSADIVNKIMKKHISMLTVDDYVIVDGKKVFKVPFPGCDVSSSELFYSADGMRYCVMYSACAANSNYADNTCGEIWVDINGAKGPNHIATDPERMGDIYPIVIMKDRFVPGSTSNSTASTNAQNLFFGNE